MPGKEAMASGDCFRNHEALLIGISHYKNKTQILWELGGIFKADSDARNMRDTLYSVGYDPSQIHLLCNQEASHERIRAKLIDLQAKRDRINVLFIFWAGHGFFDHRFGRNLLLPWDANMEDLSETTMEMEELALLAGRTNSANVVLFLDTCFSGPNVHSLVHPEWSAVWPRLLASRVLFFAGASTYLASEDSRGGLLTHCLIEGLTDKNDNFSDEEGVVYLEGLAAHLQWEIRKHTRNSSFQYPYIATNPSFLVPIGRNLRTHVDCILDRSGLRQPVIQLARMVARKRWPRSRLR